MNIVLPILLNLITLIFIISGVVTGCKNGWKYEITKLALFLGLGVGAYSLTPTIANAINLTNTIVFSGLLLISFLLALLIISLIKLKLDDNRLIKIKSNKLINNAKPIKNIKRKKRKLDKLQLKIALPSKIFGAIISVILAVCINYVIYLPCKPYIEEYCETQNIDTLQYTALDQIDRLGFEDLLNKELTEEAVEAKGDEE